MTRYAAQHILSRIALLREQKPHILVAMDGRCAAGKTTLAHRLATLCDCNIVYMDHFFLQPEQRTAERMRTAGGNVDRERFLEEALTPLLHGASFSYRPYDCKRQTFAKAIYVDAKPITIIEGSYACHPALRAHYDLTVFLTVNAQEQMRRIQHRNGPEAAIVFRDKWIPLEERYFAAYPIAQSCDLRFDMGADTEN